MNVFAASLPQPLVPRGTPSTGQAPAAGGEGVFVPSDVATIATPSGALGTAAQAGGAIGAGVGAAVGRLILPTSGAIGGAALGNLAMQAALPALPAPIGIGIGIVAGLAAGIALESKTRAGRLVGGFAGGVAGSLAGATAGVIGWQPAPALAKLATTFSVKSLPAKLLDGDHLGYRSLRHDSSAREALKSVLPGDLIVAHHENYFEAAAVLTKIGGARADYTHLGIVTEQGTVIDMVATGPEEIPINKWLKFTHLAVLRPQYASVDNLMATVEGARSAMATKTYDSDMSLKNEPEKEYCTEFIYNRLKENAPEIQLEQQSRFGIQFVSPDAFFDSKQVEVMYNSGSNFWLNHLSRYC
ncbi:MAG: hypothetical protein FJX76_05215 [Armatimonadetes bacterium]|nr:hypothetical protein [Armatimonadota bacterium]